MSNLIKILFVEHDSYDLEMMYRELEKNGLQYVFETVQDEQNYLNTIEEFVPDIILSDYSLPSFSGLRAFELRQSIIPNTPFIFVSGTIGEEKSIELIKNGVTDYVLKDKIFSLVPKIQRALTENEERISKRKAEQTIEFERNNLKSLINNTNDLMWSVDRNFNLITSNHCFDEMVKKIYGKKILPGTGRNLKGANNKLLKRFKAYYERAFLGEIFTEIEHTTIPVESWVEISFYPIRQGNQIIGTACHSRDITERREGERELKKSDAFNRGLIDSLSAHIAVLDNKGSIVTINEAWKQFALDNGETNLQRTGVGSNYFEVCKKSIKLGNKTAKKALQGIIEVMNEIIPFFYFEYECHSVDEQRWFAMRVVKFRSETPMAIVAHENITELKKAESQRDSTYEANIKLQKVEQELNDALTKEKELNELKSRFVSMASHEFRTPLTTMMSSLSLVNRYTEKNDLENQTKHIAKIKKSINNLTDILDDFLSVSKLEEGKIENHSEETNLKNFIADIVNEMQLMATESQKITQKYQGLEFISFDRKLLKNILFNLLSNALKFSKEFGVVEVNTEELEESIQISVKDNGIGISKEDQVHLFERFFRGHNATHIQGTGLGLNIVVKYTELMNATLTFESTENVGTTFSIKIPK